MPNLKTCSLVFLLEDNKILLAMKKRGFGSGRYNGIGGKVDPGETIEQTMIRETQEEIGVTPLEWSKVAVHDFNMNDGNAEPWRMVVHAYICTKWKGKPIETDEMAPEWFLLNDIPYDKMWDDDIYWLPAVLAGRKLHTAFSFDSRDRMLSAKIDIVATV